MWGLGTFKEIIDFAYKINKNGRFDKKFDNRDINLNKKIKSVKYTQEKFCDRFLKK